MVHLLSHVDSSPACLNMMTSSNGNIFRFTGPLCGEFTGPGEFPAQRPVTRSFDVLFDLRPNERLSKQPWGWWFETLSCSLWRHCNEQFHWHRWWMASLTMPAVRAVHSSNAIGPIYHIHRDHFVYAPSKWETALQCNVVSNWLGAYPQWSQHTVWPKHRILGLRLLCFVLGFR